MIYYLVRITIAAAAAAICYVTLHTMGNIHMRRDERLMSICSAAAFVLLLVVMCLCPLENRLMSFSTSQSAFKYNHSGSIIEIYEYDTCGVVISATGDENVTVTLIPGNDGERKLATLYNQKRNIVSAGYYVAELRYIPNSDDRIVIVAHGTFGNSLDAPTNVADNCGTKFNAVSYNDVPTFYYGYVVAPGDDYQLMVNGEKVKF